MDSSQNSRNYTIDDYYSYIVKGETYSGVASDNGIKLHKVVGKTTQQTTKGYQLFDASKLATKSQGGATVTNNGDGSFTVSGSGKFYHSFEVTYSYSKEDAVKILNKAGICKLNTDFNTNIRPSFLFGLYDSNGGVSNKSIYTSTSHKSFELTNEDIEKIKTGEYTLKISFYEPASETIVPGTVKPMVYVDGDGTWEPFTGGQPAPNPDYPMEIQNVEITEIYSNGSQEVDLSTKTNTVETSLKLAEGETYIDGEPITRKYKQITFDGSSDESWGFNDFSEELNEFYIRLPNGARKNYLVYCDRLISDTLYASSLTDGSCYASASALLAVYFSKDRFSSSSDLMTWLQTHPITVEYELATPTTEAIKVPTVPSYNPHTNLWTDNQVPTDMEWEIITSFLLPKIDWQASDYINIEDFNRIRNNIEWLKTMSRELYKEFPFSVALADEVGYSTYSYVELWNSLESCLQDIVDNTTVMTVGTKRTYTVFDPYIDYNELNRLERACLIYYQLFERQKLTLRKLAFKLGANWEVKI